MEWEDKVKMIRLGNKKKESDVTRKEYEDFVLKTVDGFDGQAIDMFITNETLIQEEILERKEFYTEVNKSIIKLIENPTIYENVNLRADIRLGLLDEFLK